MAKAGVKGLTKLFVCWKIC